MRIELLLGIERDDRYEICGITYFGATNLEPQYVQLKASSLAIALTKTALESGKRISVSKNHEYAEILPNDLVIEDLDELESKKRIATNDINALMHQNVLGLCIVDSMQYLDCYMKLLAAGIFIHDGNREDKYFEIIEKAQSTEEPVPLPKDASFEEEQTYIENKRKFDEAQGNLKTLEDYLNSLEAVQRVSFINKILQNAKSAVESASTIEDVDKVVNEYKSKIDVNFYGIQPKDTDVQSSLQA